MDVIYFILFLSVLYVYWKRAAKTRQKLPPGKCAKIFLRSCHETGPWLKLPVLGHIPLLGANAHTTLIKSSAKYGPVISIQLGTFPSLLTIFLSKTVPNSKYFYPSKSGRSLPTMGRFGSRPLVNPHWPVDLK